MPPRKRLASESYEADGGFVEDAPKSKKTKAVPSGTKDKSSGAKEEPESHYWEVSFASSGRCCQTSQSKLTFTSSSANALAAYKSTSSKASNWWTSGSFTRRTIRCCQGRRCVLVYCPPSRQRADPRSFSGHLSQHRAIHRVHRTAARDRKGAQSQRHHHPTS